MSGALSDAIAGNGPIVVLAANGEVIGLGTARHPDTEVANFERARGLTT
jgi:predicted RNA-binding protein with PUA domain